LHDPHRVYKTCLFCDSTDLTAEHIFTRAVAKLFPKLRNWEIDTHPLFSPSGKTKIKGSSPIVSVTSRCVCESHNTNELSRDVNKAMTCLRPLMSAKPFTFTASGQQKVRRYWERIGAIMDAETSNLDLQKPTPLGAGTNPLHRIYPPILSREDRKAWLAGHDLRDTRVFVGHHTGTLGINPLVIAAPQPVPPDNLSWVTTCKYFLFAFKNLAVVVIVGASRRKKDPLAAGFVELGAVNGDLMWPHHDKVTAARLLSLRNTERNPIHESFIREVTNSIVKNGRRKN
jgi:hypothetical protein